MSNLYDQLPILLKLQRLDEEIRQLEAKRKRFPIQQKKLDAQLAKYRALQESKKQTLLDLQKEHHTKLLDLESNQDKIAKYRVQLLQVKSNREYTALDQEISHLEDQNAQLEDSILQILLQIDEAESAVEEATATLKKYEAAIQKKKAELNARLQQLNEEIKRRKREREAIYQDPQLSPELKKRYDEWVARRGTTFIAIVTSNTCGACHITLTPQLVNELHHRNRLLTCSSCNRVLYLEPPEEPSAE